jgi:site-specific DNA-methyltransferase (adenine-specific)
MSGVERMIKSLGHMEAVKGFIQIPAKSREELRSGCLPFETFVNGAPARVDQYYRIWASSLKGKFSPGSKVQVSRTQDGYHVELLIGEEQSKVSAITPIAPEKLEENIFNNAIGIGMMENLKSKPYFRAGSIIIYNDDILKTNAIDENTIDLIVTSPPYDVDIKYENYDDSIPYDRYLEFTRRWLARCHDFARPDGRLCLNIPLDKNKGGQQSVCADITTIAKEVGWKYHSTIIWNEQNISRRTAWGSWMSASAPYVIAPVEVIIVLYKERWEKMSKGKSDITRDEFIDWTNGVWNFSGESKNRVGHPAPFPVELPKRCIKLFSFVGDSVLDPFMGSGTTLIACIETRRVGIGVEINENYCKLAVKRLEKHGIRQKKLTETL